MDESRKSRSQETEEEQLKDKRNRPDSKRATNDWLSPPRLVSLAGGEYGFDLDPCAYPLMPWQTAAVMLSDRVMARPACILPSRLHGSSRREKVACHCSHCLFELNKYSADLGDGLAFNWFGSRVWLNPPWDDPLPWAEKMAEHRVGSMLISAKSTDTKWAQTVLEVADAVLFFAGRLLYHYPSGRKSSGAWTPSMLLAFGSEDVMGLSRVIMEYPGVVLYQTD